MLYNGLLSNVLPLLKLRSHKMILSRGAPIMLWLIIGTKQSANYRPITDCLVQDASSLNKSHVVTIVKSQWYDARFVTLLL